MSSRYVFKNIAFKDDVFSSDLACERRRTDTAEGIDYRREATDVGFWERITITSEAGVKHIGRPRGAYNTLTVARMDTLSPSEIDDAIEQVARELCRMCDKARIYPERLLIVGLGNPALTPDAVGPCTADLVKPTMHLKQIDEEMFEKLECSEIAVIKTDVKGSSGIDSLDIVKGVCERIMPDGILAVDALASRAPERLGTTIQIASTGIQPGSGLGSRHGGITEENLGVPVISIGVPTVINSNMFVLTDGEISAPDDGQGMFVAPKDINEIVKKSAQIIAGAINQAFGINFF